MRRAQWTSQLARERAVDRLIGDGVVIDRIARVLNMSAPAVRKVRDRLTGETHQQRVRWMNEIARWASNHQLDVRECFAFNDLFVNLTTTCMAHPKAPLKDIDPDRGCKLCRGRSAKAPKAPTKFPYKVEATWHVEEEAYVARSPLFPELKFVADTIYAAKTGLRERGVVMLEEMVAAGKMIPPTDIRKYTRRGLATAAKAVKEIREAKPKFARNRRPKDEDVPLEHGPEDLTGDDDDGTDFDPVPEPSRKTKGRSKKSVKGVVPRTSSGDEDWTGLEDEDLEKYDPELMPDHLRERYEELFGESRVEKTT